MKDIDFDELDRAVGSVLGSDAAAHPAPQADLPVATAVREPNPKATATTAAETAVLANSEETKATAAVSPAVSPARKRGQFLDMVHPSADMTKTPKMPSTSRKSLSPLNPTITPDATQPRPANEVTSAPQVEQTTPSEDPVENKLTAQEASVAENTTANNQSWPDPLDFAKEPAETPAASQEPPVDLAIEPTGEQTITETGQTPFVTDAKVDKRPLGAFATQGDEPTDQTPAESTPSLEEAPEFNPEVNSIEATGLPQAEDETTGLTGETPKDETLTTIEQSETPSVALPAEANPPTETTESETSTAPQESPEPAAPSVTTPPVAGAQSISQQYKTAEPAKADDAHPLFDTEEYHQPLLADGKKKSKKVVLIVVMLVVLLILGAALGYIAYTVGI